MRDKLNGPITAGRLPVAGDDEKASFTLRLYKELLGEIDAVLKSIPKRRRPTRNDYIAQAIEEKIKRDQKRLGITLLNETMLPPTKSEVSPTQKRFNEDNLLEDNLL